VNTQDRDEPVTTSTRMPLALQDAIGRIERNERLDPVAGALGRAGAPLSSGRFGPVLRGEWLGHALHPLLTDLPMGCWLSAGLLDLVGGRSSRKAAQRLVGLGLLLVPPTAAAGMADWAPVTDPRSRRVGVVHAVGNTLVALVYFRSWRARRRGHHGRGRLLGFAAGLLAWGTGYLGGHLSFARGVGQGARGTDRGDGGPITVDVADDVVDLGEAARILDVPVEQVNAMVAEKMLRPIAGPAFSPRFLASEVRAVRLGGA
jgi:uncharacterized membrane protein